MPVSNNGTLAGYFLSPREYEQLRRGMRRSFDIVELTEEEFAQHELAGRMDPRHDHLNKLLEPDPKSRGPMPLPEPELVICGAASTQVAMRKDATRQ